MTTPSHDTDFHADSMFSFRPKFNMTQSNFITNIPQVKNQAVGMGVATTYNVKKRQGTSAVKVSGVDLNR